MAAPRSLATWAPALVMMGALSQYVGAAIAVKLFDRLGSPGVAWLRVVFAVLVLLAWRRPRWARFDRTERRDLARFGLALGLMNLAFYLAIDRLPLGTAVAIEFSGPIAVAAAGSRQRRDLAAVALAALGVLLLADVQWEGNAVGVLFAFGAATMWAGYIVWGRRVGASGASSGLDGLALSTGFGALAVAPIGIGALGGRAPFGGAFWLAVAACAAVALCSNVVPYALDQLVLGRLPAAQFALLSTLLPVTATVVGAVALAQRPTPPELLGVGLVVGALALRSG